MKSREYFPVVNEAGEVVGKATRSECHSGTKILHPVVHLHLFNSEGCLYLQKRAEHKDIQPGKWDTAVGGHVDYGEEPLQALYRESREELGLTGFEAVAAFHYIFESEIEREMVFSYRTVYDGPVTPDRDEVPEGRFWGIGEIRAALGQGVFTPNFEYEFSLLNL
ncbi:MAG: NUDIX domain-containing protein [Coprobacter sp.]|nr:NUDIX domain-containing protein [Coprobacter sp.]